MSKRVDPLVSQIFGFTKESMDLFFRNRDVGALLENIDRLADGKCQAVDDYLRNWVAHYFLRFLKTGKVEKKKFILIVQRKNSPEIVGLAGCVVRPETIFIDFICSGQSGINLGKKMMHEIARTARLLGKKGVDLVSLPGAIPFYTKLGFRRGPSTARGVSPESKQIRSLASRRFHAAKKFNPNYTNPLKTAVHLIKTVRKMKINDETMRTVFPRPETMVKHLLQFQNSQNIMGGKLYTSNKNERTHMLPKYSATLLKKVK